MTVPTKETMWSSAWRLRASIVDGGLSATELIEMCLTRIERLEPTLRAFITVAADQARTKAAELDASTAAGAVPGPLHGVPIAVKDELWTAGIRSTGGSLLN